MLVSLEEAVMASMTFVLKHPGARVLRSDVRIIAMNISEAKEIARTARSAWISVSISTRPIISMFNLKATLNTVSLFLKGVFNCFPRVDFLFQHKASLSVSVSISNREIRKF